MGTQTLSRRSGVIRNPLAFLQAKGFSLSELEKLTRDQIEGIAMAYWQHPDRAGYAGEISTPAGSGRRR
jgi:hypothetical protein